MRSPSLTLSHGTLSPTLTDTDKSARVRKRSTEAGANSSKLRTRNLVHDGRLSTLVAGVEERAAAMRPESRRKTHGEVMSASARLRRQLQNRARATRAGSPSDPQHYWCSEADLHRSRPEKEMISSTASEARDALLAIIHLQGGRDLSRCTMRSRGCALWALATGGSLTSQFF